MTGEGTMDGPAVAVVGMSCRFPGAAGTGEFWRNLRDGVESIRFFTAEELAAAGVDPAALGYSGYVNAGAVLEGVDLFDASFFGFSPRDAELLDPQQRLFLEECWRALEDAGCDPSASGGLIGVYAGTDMSRYMFNLLSNYEVLGTAGMLQIVLGNDKDHLTTRVSYKLNLRGPAVTVQTACSTSLVAVCQACQGLLTYQCDAALAGGTAITLPQTAGYVYQEGGISSPDGHCRTFDASAAGTVGGNGVGVVLLMRLEDALAGGYRVRAVLRGFGLNNDGAGKVGYTAPGIEGQAEAIATAQEMAGVHPETVTYIEAHGTGTPMGDPIEVAALTRVFRAHTAKRGFCGLGSVKTNFGHLNSAAGVAGLIKTVLALEHRQIPPSLHFRVPNPALRLAESPFYVVDRLRDWPANGGPRRAGVSSFGIGGTNAHVVLEEAPPSEPGAPSRPWQLLALSARTASALDTATAHLAAHLREHPELDLADAAFTLQVGRQAFEHRRILVVPGDDGGVEAACRALETGEGVLTARRQEGSRPVALLFPGQGAQRAGMGADIYRTERAYREQIDHCAGLLTPYLGLDLRDLLHPSPAGERAAAEKLARTDFAQPALFAVEYALARLWESWGVRPEAMLGHSLGEYVAACLAGVFPLEDALALVAFRGRLMQGMPEGAMLAVHLPEQEVLPLLGPELSLAAVNGPALCSVSGPPTAVRELEERLVEQGVGVRRLHTAQAFHSADADALMEPFEERVAQLALSPPAIPFLSNVTGTWITASQATDPTYWATHMRRTVRFSDGLRTLLAEPGRVLLEAGPGRPLTSLALAQARPGSTVAVSSLPHPRDGHPGMESLIEGLGRLWLAGVEVDWRGFHAGERRLRVPLPTYPFERQRFWVEPTPWTALAATAGGAAAPQRAEVDGWFYHPVWQEAPAGTARAEEPRGWLLFADETGLAEQLAVLLAAQGHEAVLVRRGMGFARSGECEFTLDPLQPAGYTALLKELRAQRRLPDRIVHLWPVTGPAPAGQPLEALCFYSVVFLAQALADQLGTHRTELAVVADGAFDTGDGGEVEPFKAMAAGACRVVAQELPALGCRFIDLDSESGEGVAGRLLGELALESGEVAVALRNGRRLARRFEPLDLPGAAPVPRLRERGVYLITGGLGGIGLTLARRLAERVRARLLLLTRSFPSREEWEEDGLEPDVAGRIRQIREIEALGAEVEIVEGDVARRADMERLARLAAGRFGGIHGIVHAAGLAGGGVVQLKTLARASQVLAPKVAGTLVLEEVFAGAGLDFFVLCSSLASVLGGPGQVDYCAANAFLDAFAERDRSRGRFTVAVNWDTWAEVGMAVNAAVPADLEALRRENLRQGILPAEGADAFERILAGPAGTVAVSTTDLPARVQLWESHGRAGAGSAARSQVRHRRPELPAAFVAPRNETERVIAEIWQELLGIEPVGVNDRFLDLGGHSLLAGQVVSRLRAALQVELPMRALFEAVTVAELAQVVERDLQGDGGSPPDFEPLPSLFSLGENPG